MRKALLILSFLLLPGPSAFAQNTDDQGNPMVGANFFRMLGAAPAATNPVPARLTDGSAFYVPALDTTLTARFPTGSTPADNESNGVSITRSGAFVFVFDGSTWDRWTGAVTANAGTNLNTSALALEAGGNLAAAATSLSVLDDWDETDRAKVNPIVGQAGVQGGAGTVTALTQRVAFATDANVIISKPVVASGSLAALEAAVTLTLGGHSGVGVVWTTSDFDGVLTPEWSADGTIWVPSRFVGITGAGATLTYTGGSVTQGFGIDIPGAATHARVRASTYTAGTMSVTMVTTLAPSLTLIGNAGSAGAVNVQDGGNSITVDGAVTANAGTNLNTSALALETSLAKLTQTQGSTTSGQSGPLIQGAVTTGAPTYTTGQTSPLSLDTAGALRVTGGGGGTQYAEDSAHVTGDTLTLAGVVQQAADAALSTDGDRSLLQVDASGFLKVNIKAGAGSGGTAAVDNSTFTGGTTNVTPMGAIFDATPPAITDGSVGAPRMTSTRVLMVDGSATTQPVSGTVTANQGTANTAANRWPMYITNGTQNMPTMDLPVRAGYTILTDGSNVIQMDVTGAIATRDNQQEGVNVPNQSTGSFALTRREDTPTTTPLTVDEEFQGLKTDSVGRLWVNPSGVTSPVSGTVTANAGTGTFIVGDGAGALNVIVDSGTTAVTQATAANLNAAVVGTGTAGSPAGNILTVQGVASMTKLLVTPDSVALPANQSVNLAQVAGTTTVTGGVAGTQGVGGVEANDAPITGNPVLVGLKASAAAPADVSADNDLVRAWALRNGSLVVNLASGGTLYDSRAITSFPDNEPFNVAQWNGVAPTAAAALADNQANPTAPLVGAFGMVWDGANWDRLPGTSADGAKVQQGTAASLNMRPDTSGATGAAPPARADFIGGLTSGATGGFVTGFAVCDSFANVTVSTATTTLIVTGVSGRHVRICSLSLVTAAANNVALISGTGATCGTGTTGMSGGTTAATGWNFAANSGVTQGSGLGAINQTNATGDSVCVVTSAATQLSGRLAYAIY